MAYDYTPAYVSLADAKAAMAQQLACWYTPGTDTVNDDYALQDIEAVENQVNGYLRGGLYLTPYTGPDLAMLRALVIDLLRSRAYNRRPAPDSPQEIVQAKADALATLRDIQAGKFRLTTDAVALATAVNAAFATTGGSDPTWSTKQTRGW